MRTKTITRAFDPRTPHALPVPLLRRLLAGVAAAAAALFVIWATMGVAQPMSPPANPAWQHFQADHFSFSYPAGWTVTETAEDGVYRLAPSGREAGTHIVLSLLPAERTDLGSVERMGVAHVERNEAVARHYLRILPRARLAGRAVGQVRYTADLVSGERVEGVWVGIPQAEGRVLTVVFNAYPDTYFKGIQHTFNRLLASITVNG